MNTCIKNKRLLFVVPSTGAVTDFYEGVLQAAAANGISCMEIHLRGAESYEELLDRLEDGVVPIVIKD